MNVYQRTASREEYLNNLVESRPVIISHAFYPATLVLFSSRLITKSAHGSNNGGYAQSRQDGLPLTNYDLVTATADCPMNQQQRRKLRTPPPYAITPGGISHMASGWFKKIASIKEEELYSHWKMLKLDTDLPSPPLCLLKLPSILIYRMSNILSW